MSQIVLALDTSTPVLSAALVRRTPDGTLCALARERIAPPAVTSTLVPAVFDKMLGDAGLSLGAVDLFVTGLGPGLFTGVRVSVATMKAVAYARQKPLIGAESLESMAFGAARGVDSETIEPGTLPDSGLLCAALDARKGEVYWAMYRAEGGRLATVVAPRATTRTVLAEELARQPSKVRVFGTGTVGFSSSDRLQVDASPQTPSAFEITALALDRNPGTTFDAAAVLALEPFYLRPPEAEVARLQRELSAAPPVAPR